MGELRTGNGVTDPLERQRFLNISDDFGISEHGSKSPGGPKSP